VLLQQIEKLLGSHEAKLSIWRSPRPAGGEGGKVPRAKAKAKRVAGKAVAAKGKRVGVKRVVKKK